MADWSLMTLQLRGKTRRFVQATLVRQDTDALARAAARRVQPLRRLLQDPLQAARSSAPTPRASTPAASTSTRFSQCRLYPLHAADLLELEGQCSYTFEPEPSRSPVRPLPEPALD